MNGYYEELSSKGDWGSFLTDDFLLTGSVAKESRGRDAYLNNNFFKLVKGLRVKKIIVQGVNACALVSYALVSPEGNNFSCDVAELWTARNGKLDSVAIFFDTAAFRKSMS